MVQQAGVSDSSARFIRDLSHYLVDYELTEVDKKKIKGIYERNALSDPIVVVEKVVEVRERVVNKYIYIGNNGRIKEIKSVIVKPGDIRDFICENFKLTDFDTYPTRKRTYGDARKMYCYLLRVYSCMEWANIGSLIASRSRNKHWDHSDAIHASKSFDRVKKTDPKFAPLFIKFLNQFNLKEHDYPNGKINTGGNRDSGLPGKPL